MTELLSRSQALEMFDRRLSGLDQTITTRDALMELRTDTNLTIRSLSITYGEQHNALRMTLADFRRHLSRIIHREKKKEELSPGDDDADQSDTPTVVGWDTIKKGSD